MASDGRIAVFGRGQELARIDAVLDSAMAGSGGGLVLVGDAGAGKSTLARAALGRAEERGMNVRLGRCEPLEIERPFGAVLDALGLRLADVLAAGSGADHRIGTALSAGNTYLAAEHLLGSIEQQVATRPLLLVLEDLHWADPSTIEVAVRVLGLACDLPLAVVATTRPPALGSGLHRLVLHSDDRAVALAPLDPAAVADLVTATIGGAPDDSLERALRDAGGNPLLITAVLDSLRAAEAITVENGIATVRPGIGELRPNAMLATRLSEVDTEVMVLLQIAAILGPSVTPSELAPVLGRRATDLLPLLAAACQAGMLIAEPAAYAFRHELLRTAVLDTMPESMQRAIHVDAARALASVGAPPLDVAEHFAQGAASGDLQAIEWLERAAAEMLATTPGTALHLIELAIDLSSGTVGQRLLQTKVRALAATGRTEETEVLARALLHDELDRETEAQLQREIGFSHFLRGHPAEALAASERLLGLVDGPAQLARATAEVAMARFISLDYAGARTAAVEATELSSKGGDTPSRVAAGGVLCWLDLFANDIEASLGWATEIVTLGEHVPTAHLYQPWFFASLAHLEVDHHEDLVAATREGRRVAERTGVAWALPGYDALTAYSLFRRGALDDAAAVAEATIGYMDGVDGFGVALWCHAFLAHIALHRGDVPTAEQHLGYAQRHLTGRAQFGLEHSVSVQVRIHEQRGDLQAAFNALSMMWDLYGASGALCARHALGFDVVRLACELGDTARATEVATTLRAAAEQTGIPAFHAYAAMARAWEATDPLGVVAAAESMLATPRLVTGAELLARASEFVRARGSTADADQLAFRSAQIYSACGADADAQAVQTTITGSAPRVAARPTLGWGALTTKERHVAELVGDGLANAAIAGELYVSRRTVETHISAIYRKLEVTSRVELVRLLLSRGSAAPRGTS